MLWIAHASSVRFDATPAVRVPDADRRVDPDIPCQRSPDTGSFLKEAIPHRATAHKCALQPPFRLCRNTSITDDISLSRSSWIPRPDSSPESAHAFHAGSPRHSVLAVSIGPGTSSTTSRFQREGEQRRSRDWDRGDCTGMKRGDCLRQQPAVRSTELSRNDGRADRVHWCGHGVALDSWGGSPSGVD